MNFSAAHLFSRASTAALQIQDALRKITTTNSSGAEARWQSSGHIELSSDPTG
jgi:hypothetical protein